jgi:hypothetical protein
MVTSLSSTYLINVMVEVTLALDSLVAYNFFTSEAGAEK